MKSMPQKILVTGVNGQLGHDVVKVLNARGIACRGVDIEDFDITDAAATEAYILDYRPDAVVHCSAFTAVDKAEDQPELCEKVNAGGPRNIAEACKAIGAAMVYISTDYVFPGVGERPYEVGDPTGPQSVYGRTKLLGEEAVRGILQKYYIARISWAFGVNGANIVKTFLRLGAERDSVTVVRDQIGSPTYTADLAPALCDLMDTGAYGTYHITNEGFCSWAEFASEIFRLAGRNTKVIPVTSDQYPAKAKRPLNSRLSKAALDAAGVRRLPAWQDALARYLKEIRA